jgi:hypothetical protein
VNNVPEFSYVKQCVIVLTFRLNSVTVIVAVGNCLKENKKHEATNFHNFLLLFLFISTAIWGSSFVTCTTKNVQIFTQCQSSVINVAEIESWF